MDKRCSKCGITKPFAEFHRDLSRRRSVPYVPNCKPCVAERSRNYRNQPGKREERNATVKLWVQANHTRVLEKEAKRRLEKRAQCLIANARTRARKRRIPFTLDAHVDEIQQRIDAGKCELTGVPFDLSPGRKFNSPSIDRIDPKQGYTINNVRLVLYLVNAALGNWGEFTLREVMTQWLKQG